VYLLVIMIVIGGGPHFTATEFLPHHGALHPKARCLDARDIVRAQITRTRGESSSWNGRWWVVCFDRSGNVVERDQ